MHTKTLLFATLAVTARILAQEIENEDVPSQCRDICANTLAVSDRCNSGDDDVELNCICTSPSAMSDIPNCEACVAEYDESDNNVRDIVRSCSFTIAATFTTPGASSTSEMSATATGTSTTVVMMSASGSATAGAIGGSGSGVDGVASSVSVVTSVVTTGVQAGATQTSDDDDSATAGSDGNAAMGMGIPALLVLGAAVLGAAAML